jgi:anaerobic ribonucleoside-triphosphate reductase
MICDELKLYDQKLEQFDGDAATTRTLRNIRNTLKSALEPYGGSRRLNEILKMHGLHPKNFDFVSNIENLINARLNDVSIDDNSNKEDKTIEAIHQEVFSCAKKAIGYDMLYRMMREKYGKEEAKRLSGSLYNFSLAMADSTNILKPYCYSINASSLVTTGRPFGQLPSKPAKRVSAYISALCETVHQLASHLAGAIAIGSFFLDITHLMIYKQKIALRDIQCDASCRKTLENEFQQFIHSVNHLSRNSNESPFTNVSIFDRIKLNTLIEDMAWYFPTDSISAEEIIEYIIEVQNVYLDLYDKGDPSNNGRPYRFPVVTVNISRGGDNSIQDAVFLKDICNRSIFRYNIFASSGTKVASCCRLINNTEMMQLAGQANSFGGTSISLGSHRVVTVNFNRIALEANSIDQFYSILESRIEDAAKILAAHKDLIKLTHDKRLQMFISNGWISLSRLFSTFGILGLVEATDTICRKLGVDGDDNEDAFKHGVLTFLNAKVAEMSEKYNIIGNIEQIPGESMAPKLAYVDKLLFGKGQVPYELYSNQFVPLWKNASLWERLEADGKYNQLITGGGIAHAQIGEQITAVQAEKIIRYAINCGCEHFALNAVFAECKKGHVHLGKFATCPSCNSEIVDYMTRVVGFFTRVSAWNSVRREWEFPKRTFVAPE